nr:immunoglobulin light chain junction region [Macaca mulatta]MOX52102.1 immunoglobulin light chain junction region [Macaca mulatta]MOX52432.1 immunoglobulin light chain junction region [Macaca mulatta]MOX54053.1 immunoglobulin light chain junction region [Macaca mulatta]MOX54102.1 immunoglobulin light chain junction region [Macaca mulatta]
CQQHNAYPFTF